MEEILRAVVYAIPAYAANGTPVVAVRLVGRVHPLDRGLIFRDGRRLLGDGKTFEGLVSGLSMGLLAAAAVMTLMPSVYRGPLEAALLPIGAMVGDVCGSFVKRRLGLERGKSAPLLDQLGFMVAALILAWLPHGAPSWATPTTLFALLLITAVLHISTNALAYLARLKERWY